MNKLIAQLAGARTPGWVRRLPPSLKRWLKPILVTAVVATVVTGLLVPFLENTFFDFLISTQVVGFTLMLLIYPAMNARLSLFWRIACALAAVAVGAFVGTILVTFVKGRDLSTMFSDPHSAWGFAATAMIGFIVGLIAVAVMGVRARIAHAEADLLRVEAERQVLARKNVEAELNVIRAQIEPHFLVNTLSNLSFLIKEDPDQALAMLENLIDYLQAALPRIRGETSTLRNEVAMTSAYIAILQIRMGERIRASFDIPPALLGAPFPPMMLITLVENAIQHGLNPLMEGGTVTICARNEATRLIISVSDDGAGFKLPPRGIHGSPGELGAPGPREGIGLANIRGRLQAMHGNNARLTITENLPRGTIATIELPLEIALA